MRSLYLNAHHMPELLEAVRGHQICVENAASASEETKAICADLVRRVELLNRVIEAGDDYEEAVATYNKYVNDNDDDEFDLFDKCEDNPPAPIDWSRAKYYVNPDSRLRMDGMFSPEAQRMSFDEMKADLLKAVGEPTNDPAPTVSSVKVVNRPL